MQSKLNKDIIDPVGIFHMNLNTIYTEGLDEFKNVIIEFKILSKHIHFIQTFRLQIQLSKLNEI